MINSWHPSEQLREAMSEHDAGHLQRLFAEALQTSTEEASHLGSVATANKFIEAHNLQATEDGRDQLHFIATVEGKRVDGLLYLLKEIDRYFLIQVGILNELIPQVDEDVQERLTIMQRAIVQNENVVRLTIEHTEGDR